MHRALAPLLGLALLLPLAPLGAGGDGRGEVVPYSIMVDGKVATGLLGVPDGPPRALVVYGHGYGNTVESWVQHLHQAAGQGHLAVAMDYSPFFDLDRGAAETNAAALALADGWGIEVVALFGVSMGGAVTGLALAEAPQRADGSDLYDWWFDVEGVSMLHETWLEATAVGHPSAPQIEEETGGTPLEVPQEYVRRSVALRPLDVREHVGGVVVLHALNDGLVPYDQGREAALTLRAVGLPLDFYTIVRGDPAELGTTGTAALGLPNPLDLAGHAWEGSSTHPVMRTALARLWALLKGGEAPLVGEFIVDAQLGQVPP